MIKKIALITTIILMMCFFTSYSSAIEFSNVKSDKELVKNPSFDEFTHTVLVEFGTATWCTYCPQVSEYLQSTYRSGYNMYIVTLNADEPPARERIDDLPNNPNRAFPCVWIDGGIKTIVADKGSDIPYKNNISYCGQRDVKDIDLKLSLTWEDANIGVILEVTNNEQSTYNGHIHAYITEIESRWSYPNEGAFHYAMIDYAIHEDITVSANNKKEYSASWDGAENGYADITQENIMIVVSVFSEQSNYADETIALKATETENEEPTPPPPEPDKNALDIKIKNRIEIGNVGLSIKKITIEVENSVYSNITYNICVSTFLSKKIVEESGILEKGETGLAIIVDNHIGPIIIKATASSYDGEISVSDSKIGFMIGPIILLK